MSSAIALLVAIPLGTIIAIYLSEFAPFQPARVAKPFLELLGGIPTIVFGYFALLFVTPLLQTIWPSLPGFNLLSAGLVMGIMIIPYVSSLSEDAMRSVPMNLREASYAMGATRLQTAVRVVAPAAFSGIAAPTSRRVAGGRGDDDCRDRRGHAAQSHVEPGRAGRDDHCIIVQVALGDLPHGSIAYQTIFAAGLTLALITLFFNVLGHLLRKRYRQVY